MSRTLFLTGASGFVGSAALERVMWDTDWYVVCPTTMRHMGSQTNLVELRDKYPDRIRIVPCDLSMPFTADVFGDDLPAIDFIWNIASESHVDRSLTEPAAFIRNNVELMINVLEFAREVQPKIFLHMSTDEVYGPLEDETDAPHKEWSAHKPSNPYAASKAAQESIAYSYWRAFGIPLIMTNTMNLIGPRQHPEKFIPKTIRALTAGEKVTIHSSPEGESGSRCWIGIEDFADAWLWLTQKFDLILQSGRHASHLTYYPDMPKEPHRFNIVGQRATNLHVAELIAEIVGVDGDFEMVNFHTSRPGHDMHYGLDGGKLARLGWTPPMLLVDRLIHTVHWYQDNPRALEVGQ